jgi:hypothetical protein
MDKGAAYAQYETGTLRMLINEFDNCGDVVFPAFPMHEADLVHHERLKAVVLVPRSVADKVALFCIKHKEILKFAYRAMKAEKANLKDVTVNEEYLKMYFTNCDFPLNKNKK